MSVDLAGIAKSLQARIQELVLEFSGLRAEMRANQAAVVECRSEQVRSDNCVRTSSDAIAAYNETGWFSRAWDELFGEKGDRLMREQGAANSAASQNRERATALEGADSSLSVRERKLHVKEMKLAKEVLSALTGDYCRANLVLRQARGRLRKLRWALSIRPDLFDAIRFASDPIEQIELRIVNDLEQEWMFPDATVEMGGVVAELGELRKAFSSMLSDSYRYSRRTLPHLRKELVRLLTESRTDKMGAVFSGVDEALTYFPASELSDAINQLTSSNQAERFAKGLCGVAAGRSVSYEYLAKCVRNVGGLDRILTFARKNAPDGLDEFLHQLSMMNPSMSREVYVRSRAYSRARLVSMTTIASELLAYLPNDGTPKTGVMA